jgi:hypothetical protein
MYTYLPKSVVVVGLFLGLVLTCGPPSLNFLKYSSNLVKLADPSSSWLALKPVQQHVHTS